MKDAEKPRQQLASELKELGQQIADLKALEAERREAEEGQRRALAEALVATQALRENERFLQGVFEAIQDGISVLDRDLNVIRVSHWMERMYADQTPLVGKKCYEVYQQRQTPCPWCPSIPTIETGEAHTEIVPYPSAEKPTGWIELSAFPVKAANDRVVSVIEYVKDITERKQAEEALQQRNRELELLNRASQALTSTLDLDQVLATVLEEVRHLLNVAASSIWLIDPATDELVCRQAAGPQSKIVRGWHLAPGEGIAGWVARHGESLIVPDTQTDERHFKGVDQQTGLPLRSILSVPLQAKQRVIGALQVLDTDIGRFDTEDLALMEPLAASAAIAIENAQLYQQAQQEILERARAEEEIRQRTAQLEALREVELEIAAQLDLDDLLRSIVTRAIELLGGTEGGLYLYRPDRDVLEWTVAIGPNVAPIGSTLRRGEGLSGMVLETGDPFIVEDYEQWKGKPASYDGHPWSAALAAPIRWGDEYLGVLNVLTDSPHTFSSTDAELLNLFAGHAATAIENARLYEEAQQRVAELEVLQRTSLQLTSSLDLPAVLDTITTSALALVGASDCHIYLYDEPTETFTFGAALWENGRREPAVSTPRRNGLTANVARQGQPIIINDVPHHPLYAARQAQAWGLHAIAGLPLKRADRVVGVFTIAFLRPHTFSPEEVRALGLLADQAAIAIENAQLYKQVRDHAEELERRVQERTAQIQAQYAWLEAILHSTTDGIVVVDDEGNIAHANPVAQAWLSQTLLPEEADRLREAIQDLVQRADETPEMVLGFTGLDLELSAAPVIEEGMGEPSAAVIAIHNVTQLKSLDRMKTQFVTNISHELRTPITTIKLYAHLLQRTSPKDKKWTDYLDALVQEADHQAQLGEDILHISRIHDGLLQTAPRPTSLDELVEAAAIRQQAMARERCVTVEHHLAQPGLVALVDPRQIMQVLEILVGEAIHFTPPSGRVVISSRQKEAEGRLWATVSVSDTGDVIPAEDLPHIFERFFREEEPRSVRVSAAGLKLMIVKGIVELNGGQVMVESPVTGSGRTHTGELAPNGAENAEQLLMDEQNAGVTFTVYLPLAD